MQENTEKVSRSPRGRKKKKTRPRSVRKNRSYRLCPEGTLGEAGRDPLATLSGEFRDALAECERLVGLSIDDLTRIGLVKLVAEIEEAGRILPMSGQWADEPVASIDMGPVIASLPERDRDAFHVQAERSGMAFGRFCEQIIRNGLAVETSPEPPTPRRRSPFWSSIVLAAFALLTGSPLSSPS